MRQLIMELRKLLEDSPSAKLAKLPKIKLKGIAKTIDIKKVIGAKRKGFVLLPKGISKAELLKLAKKAARLKKEAEERRKEKERKKKEKARRHQTNK